MLEIDRLARQFNGRSMRCDVSRQLRKAKGSDMLIPADCWQLDTDDRTLGMFDSKDGNWPVAATKIEFISASS
jgi:hypothetical protein